ncbi:MAG: M50 family metallopeptidase [Patescibacteria group bacterium]
MLLATIATFAVILAVLVLVHEAGHFFAARIFGIRADEFGFGFPPRLFGAQKLKNGKWKFLSARGEGDPEGGTVYSLNWFPLGGFVKIKGESGENQKDPDSFAARPIWQRGVVLAAGVTMNVVLAFVLLVAALMIGMPQDVRDLSDRDLAKIKNPQVQILEVEKGFPADGIFRPGDVIVSLDGIKIKTIDDVQKYVNAHREGIRVGYLRGKIEGESRLVPKVIEGEDRAVFGVNLSEVAFVSYPIHTSIIKGFNSTFSLIGAILNGYYDLFARLFSGKGVSAEISGPIGIAVYTGMVVKLGFIYVLQFAVVLSLNLAILNFIPMPALDGGRFLFLVIEKIRGKAVHVRIENFSHTVGFILLMTLVVVITYRDIARWGGDIVRVFKDALGW